jgi:hypothetical protein
MSAFTPNVLDPESRSGQRRRDDVLLAGSVGGSRDTMGVDLAHDAGPEDRSTDDQDRRPVARTLSPGERILPATMSNELCAAERSGLPRGSGAPRRGAVAGLVPSGRSGGPRPGPRLPGRPGRAAIFCRSRVAACGP